MSRTVGVTWSDGSIRIVDAANNAGLKKELSYWKRESVVENYRRTMQTTNSSLHLVDGNDLITYPGFLHRVKEYFNGDISIYDTRTPMPELDIDKAMTGLLDQQKPIVYTALKSRGGVISAPTGFGKTYMAAAIINAYSNDELLMRNTPLCVFACPDRDINMQNYEGLSRILKDRDVGICQSGTKKVITDDVMIVTLDSLHHIDLDRVGLFICDEVHAGVSDSRVLDIVKANKADRYGVSATPAGRFDGKDKVIEALFGPIVCQVSYQDGVNSGILVPIRVIWVESPTPTYNLRNYVQLKNRETRIRHGITRNVKRNKLIADIMSNIPDTMQTLAIAPHVEHISGIRKHFPDLGVCHATTSEKALMDRGISNVPAITAKQRKEIYDKMVSGECKKMIATYVYKQGVSFPNLEVLLNVGAGGSKITAAQIPGRASRTAAGKEEAVVIDFWHPWDVVEETKDGPLFSGDKQRRRLYNKLGFDQTWVDGDVDSVIKELLKKE